MLLFIFQNLAQVNKFIEYLERLYEKKQRSLPKWIDEGLFKIEKKFLELNKMSGRVDKLHQLTKFRRHLLKLKQLSVYGFNSAKFDIPVLAGPLLNHLKKKGPVSILKKMNSYIAIITPKFAFKDVLRFHSPCSYDQFVTQWGEAGAKSIWPHGFFNSIEEINNTKSFPKRAAFANNLRDNKLPEIELYIKAKREFYRRKLLPKTHKDHICTMRGFLRFYNIQKLT